MVAALRTAAGKQPSCRFIALGTRPADSNALVRADARGRRGLLTDHTRRLLTCRHSKSALGYKPIQACRYMPDLLRSIRKEAVEAKSDESMLASFRALRLNQGTS